MYQKSVSYSKPVNFTKTLELREKKLVLNYIWDFLKMKKNANFEKGIGHNRGSIRFRCQSQPGYEPMPLISLSGRLISALILPTSYLYSWKIDMYVCADIFIKVALSK